MLLLPGTAEVLAGVLRVLDTASEDLSGIVNVMPCPPMPFVLPEMHGRVVVMVLACHVGPEDVAAADLAPLRTLAEPIADLIRPMRYPELYLPEPGGEPPILVSRTAFLESLDEAAAGCMLDLLATSDAPMRLLGLRPLGGAVASVAADATAYAHRDRRLMAFVFAVATGPDDVPNRAAWLDGLVGNLRTVPGAYVNFLGDEGEAGVRQAYPGATWDRLAVTKRRYDPDNLFRHVQNVPPA